MNKNIFILAMLFFALFFSSCEKDEKTDGNASSPSYIDGQYSAVSSIKDEWGGSAKVEMTIKDGKISSCVFYSYEADGKLKDADYGKVDGEIKNLGLYKIAQAAVFNSNKYGELLVKEQDIDKLDAISGATVSFALFKDAVKQIMKEATPKEESFNDTSNEEDETCNS